MLSDAQSKKRLPLPVAVCGLAAYATTGRQV